jgi:hypothetical protein
VKDYLAFFSIFYHIFLKIRRLCAFKGIGLQKTSFFIAVMRSLNNHNCCLKKEKTVPPFIAEKLLKIYL